MNDPKAKLPFRMPPGPHWSWDPANFHKCTTIVDPDFGIGFGCQPVNPIERCKIEPVTRRPKPVEVIDDFCRRLRAGMTTVQDADWIEKEWAARLGRVQLVSEAVPEALVDVLVVIACDESETGWSFDMGFRKTDGRWLLTGAEIAIHPVAWMHLPPIPRWLVDLMEQPIQSDALTRELTRSLMAGIGVRSDSNSEGESDENDNG